MKKILGLVILLIPFWVQAQITQWRGPERSGIFNETGLLKQWPEQGPELLLKVDGLGKGWSSPIPYRGKIYVTGMIDTLDYLSCIDANGTIEWQTPYGRSWSQSYPDTRSTPTIENGLIYLSSGSGEVVCIDAYSGKAVWHQNVFAENKGEAGRWGVAESILLVDNKVVFTTGGKQTLMVALNKKTGEEVWKTKSLNDEIGYVSPILVEQNGVKQIISLSARNLFGINPENGEIMWNYDYMNIDDAEWGENGAVINCTSPIYHNNELYVTSGYNHIGAKFKLEEDLSGVELLWKDKLLDNHHGGVVVLDGVIYGSNWENNSRGNWCAISFDTGEKFYEEKFQNKGSIIAADEMLYIYTEQPGVVGLVRPNKEKFDLVSSFRITEGGGPNWAHPYIRNGKLYIRHGEVLFVYNIKAE